MNDTDADELRSWLAGRAAHYGKVDLSEIDYDTPLGRYGLDSVSAVSMAVDIEDEYGVELDMKMIWRYRTVNRLADMLTKLNAASLPVFLNPTPPRSGR
jgi:acyl carrier protein